MFRWGLILSQVLTPYTTPVIYIYLDRLQTLMFRHETKPATGDRAATLPAE